MMSAYSPPVRAGRWGGHSPCRHSCGADVTVVHRDTFPCMNNIHVETAVSHGCRVDYLSENNGADIYISAAAISDLAPVMMNGKIPGGKAVRLELEPLPKLLDRVMQDYAPLTIAFKLGRRPEKKAKAMIDHGVAMVLMNAPGTMGRETGKYVRLRGAGYGTVAGLQGRDCSTGVGGDSQGPSPARRVYIPGACSLSRKSILSLYLPDFIYLPLLKPRNLLDIFIKCLCKY